ncbi:Sugar kinase of the NBD/HSP70 family, may contain an N-terminal HTH domain [Jatrophihabitans endophyticus]|uniref:Sugar kinase of the NBD/HSP70 family, may contain an N-terminal HTH domain n=1 Tax=Jatrophihabitans endophyticus TaxID=1206085 RepID=A0A1M5N4D2_9ACTN|nr:ROK family transcriptional regulator [Jatrophihabitans endophyticus]SHG84408.1 Sugar kinase of the NBD/HSP70 family, may contain an N-terminal HTH domain [Jatrophihabitans endophyticus]
MVASPAARPDAIRRHNLALVLGHIHRDGALTRAELTQRLRVSRSTMGALVADLLELGLVGEVVPNGGSSVGRPSHVVGPHDRGPYVVAVDIDVTHVVTAAIGLGGDVLARQLVPTGPAASEPETAARIVVESVERVSRATGRSAPPLTVGVSVPGTVDLESGHIAVAPNLEWHDIAFGALLTDALPEHTRVRIGNDADLAVFAEHLRGAARGFDDVVYLLGRTGVGAGIVVDGRPLRGYDGYAGEIGHNVIDSSGPPCHCGKHGCTETYIGEGALLARAGRPLPPTDEAVSRFFTDARSGDASAVGAVRDVAEPLGRTIGTLVNTLNPQRVLLGGTLSHMLDLARPEIEAAVSHYAVETPGRSVELIQPAFGTDSPLLGAAELAFADLLSDPLIAGG